MLSFLYNIFITPIESLVEFIFYFMNKIFADQPAYSIVFVSLAINLLILPLYKRADDMQEREREKVKSMERWNKHIKKTFKGDERYMMQTAYYRIEGYKPIYAVTGSLSLLFQIPFFIAAYHFLSNLDLLNGKSFWLIADLGAEDGIIKLGGLAINLLPILMTTINILSGVIYTKGFKLKDKIQLYTMALIFLVLLYKSPSGLVLYWTLNNLFSLLKNVFFKIVKHKRLAINILSATAGTGLFVLLIKSGRLFVRRQFFLFALVMMASFVPALLSLLDKFAGKFKEKLMKSLEFSSKESGYINKMFWLGALFNTILLGVMVPAELINSSPTEFGTLVHTGPLSLIANTASIYIGLFLVWIGIFYAISGNALKKVFAYGMWIIGVCSLINYYAFYGKFGIMSYMLVFDNAPEYNDLGKLFNLAVLVLATIALIFIAKKWPKVSTGALTVLIMMTVIISGMSIVKTQKNLNEEGYYEYKQDSTISPTVPLSRNGKNVIVIMLDRAVNEYVPYIFKEKPEIAKQFEEFVYYPNTTSFGGCTNYATPALYGGYEYTPSEMNKRSDEKLVDKHNEALKVLPVLFSENGYDVNVVDPPYANYKEIPDVSIFNEYENISGHVTMNKYAEYEVYTEDELIAQQKHIACYSLFRTVPVLFQNSIYDDGNYLSKPISGDSWKNGSTTYCAEAYAVLDYLDEYTYIENDDKGRLLVLTNCTTHEPTWLETPEYVIGPNISNPTQEYLDSLVIEGKRLTMDDWVEIQHYHVNVAAYKLLGEFFDYMKEEGIYDNTRIIIVSDHGWPVMQMDNVALDDDTSIETFNPVLMVKDFADSDVLLQGEIRHLAEANLNLCESYMTNADVATLCVTGLITDPVNPFTGNKINNDAKNNLPMLITSSQNTSVSVNNGNTYDTSDHPWIEFYGGDVKDPSNWKIIYED